MPAKKDDVRSGEASSLSAGFPSPSVGVGNGGQPPAGRSWPYRWLVAFGQFWWDFLVGDTPELLIGVLVALGIVALLVKGAALNAVAVVGFPLMVAVMLGLSAYRARPKR
jgi:hypothetical protein